MKEFKLIVAGSRGFRDYPLLTKEIIHMANDGDLKDYQVSIVTGMAQGADQLGYRFALEYGVTHYKFPAAWQRPDGSVDKGAGFKRNEDMAVFSDGLLAFWDGQSPGTKDMVDRMLKRSKPVFVVRY